MIELYSGATMNGRRAAIALAECGLAHRVHLLDLQKGHQRAADFLKLNPSGAIPVLVDDHGGVGTPVTVTQSGAIVLYCAEKSGRLIPSDPRRRRQAFEWFSQAPDRCRTCIIGDLPDVYRPGAESLECELLRAEILEALFQRGQTARWTRIHR